MKKRISNKPETFDFIRCHNYSNSHSSPSKNASICMDLRRDPHTHIKRERTILQLPKIFPIQNSSKPRRYLESYLLHDESNLNLRGTRCAPKDQHDRTAQEVTIQRQEEEKSNKNSQKYETMKFAFLQSQLHCNGISKVTLQAKSRLNVWIEEGNNSRLINQLIRKRNSLKISSQKKDANIVWTRFCDWEAASTASKFVETQKQIKNRLSGGRSILERNLESIKSQSTKDLERLEQQSLKQIQLIDFKMHNHLKNHYEISDKKCLFKNIRRYCQAQKIEQNRLIPKTYHLNGSSEIDQLPSSIGNDDTLWMIKPGEDTNRGTGITVQRGREKIIKSILELQKNGKSSLVQQYIDPLLYRGRKFDIRCYVLVTSFRGVVKAYWYQEGYLRTCSKEFSYDPQNVYGHLTNDAVQKRCKDYGKYEQCNKLSFADLENLLKSKQINFHETLDQMKSMAYHSIRAAEDKLRADKNIFAFQIFGYDFLIDSKGKVWLIQINTNPCLEFAGSLLSRIIWHMIQNSLAIALDPLLYNHNDSFASSRDKFDKIYEDNKYSCLI